MTNLSLNVNLLLPAEDDVTLLVGPGIDLQELPWKQAELNPGKSTEVNSNGQRVTVAY
jgi:hypothetical protein